MSKPLVIAVDGPSGSGKSSVCRAVATQLGLEYLDTGSMYRAITWQIQSQGIDLDDSAQIAASAGTQIVLPSTDPAEPGITVAGFDVSGQIRSEEVTRAVSAVSAVQQVREILVSQQREIVEKSRSGIVVEGRDICSVVLPNAQVKIFITADPAVRASRRAAEIGSESVEQEESLMIRDLADSTRASSPLEIAPDAVVIDTTHMELSAVIGQVIDLVRATNG